MKTEQDYCCFVDGSYEIEIGIFEPEEDNCSEIPKGEYVWFGVDIDQHEPEVEPDDEGEQSKEWIYFEESVPVRKVDEHVGLLVVLSA